MAAVTLDPSDFAPWGISDQAKLAALIADALARARVVAPCISEDTFAYADAAKATLREAVLRRLDAGTGTVITRARGTGPFSESETIDNRQARSILSARDEADLSRLCVMSSGVKRARGGSINLDPGANDPRAVDVFATIPFPWFSYNLPDEQWG